MKKKLIALLTFVSDNIPVTKSKAGTGMNCYKLEQIETHKQAIKTLASACEWQLRYFKPKYNPKTRILEGQTSAMILEEKEAYFNPGNSNVTESM